MKRISIIILAVLAGINCVMAESNRQERRAINEGNRLYKEGKLAKAAAEYNKALSANASSAEARFNLGLTQIQLAVKDTADKQRSQDLMRAGTDALGHIAQMGATKPLLASKANYNLGNLAFNTQQYQQALSLYKQALRLNPNDNNARRNLRITQKKLQEQQNQNQDQNKDQDKQDQQKDQQKDQDQDKDKNKNQEQNKQEPPQQDQERMNQQTADRILKSIENKEDRTRARVNARAGGKEKGASGSSNKRW